MAEMRPEPVNDCPKCGYWLEKKVLADSDHRIHASWKYCGECGWDQRHAAPSSTEGER